MKLSKTQEKVLNELKEDIDVARNNSYEDWMWATNKGTRTDYIEKWIKEENFKDYWEKYRKGIVLALANTKTLEKLEKEGLIKIIEVGGKMPDWVEVLNY